MKKVNFRRKRFFAVIIPLVIILSLFCSEDEEDTGLLTLTVLKEEISETVDGAGMDSMEKKAVERDVSRKNKEEETTVLKKKSSAAELVSVVVKIQPGDIVKIYGVEDTLIELELPLGIYNIQIEFLDENEQVLYSADTTEVLVEVNSVTKISLTARAEFPFDAPEFVGLDEYNVNNNGIYSLLWNSVSKGEKYILEESLDSLFSQSEGIYGGPDTSYTVTKDSSGVFYYRVMAENGLGASPYGEYTVFEVNITDELIVLDDTLGQGKVNSDYHHSFTASGGVPPYHWEIIDGETPSGLILSEEGVLSGAPEVPGVYSLTIFVEDSGEPERNARKDFTLTVFPEDLNIITVNLKEGKQGVAYQDTLRVEGGSPPYSWELIEGTLPEGLTLAANGIISGTPFEAGEFFLRVKVSDSFDPELNAEQDLTLAVTGEDLMIITSELDTGRVNDAYSDTLRAQGGEPPYTWLLSRGNIPEGMNLNPRGEITGVPTESGDFEMTVLVIDSREKPDSVEKDLILAIEAEELLIVSDSLKKGEMGIQYNDALLAQGGTPPYEWEITAGELPLGMTLSSNGLVSGIPEESGVFIVNIQVIDSGDPEQRAEKEMDIHITGTGLEIISDALPYGRIGESYSYTMEGEGGAPPYSWSVLTGTLPGGMDLSSSGILAGTPTEAVIVQLEIGLEDANERSVEGSFEWIVYPESLYVLTESLAPGEKNEAYEFALEATGGMAPLQWSLEEGTPPSGIDFSAEGILRGVPSETGSFSLRIKVEDSFDSTQSDSRILILKINSPYEDLLIVTSSLPEGNAGVPYGVQLEAEGGISPYSWELIGGSLPEGLSFSSSGLLSGTPAESAEEELTITVKDQSSEVMSDTTVLFLKINPEDLQITTNALPDGKLGGKYKILLSATGGARPFQWELFSGKLPKGLGLSDFGLIMGTVMEAGIFNVGIAVEDSSGQRDEKNYSIHVPENSFEIITSNLADGTVGEEYTALIEGEGGVPPYEFSVVSGSLPLGTQLATDGTLSGIPQEYGDYAFTARGEDYVGQMDDAELSIEVYPADFAWVTDTLPDGKEGDEYGVSLEVTGGREPYSWRVSSNELPEGLELSNDGSILGTPEASGEFRFAIEVSSAPAKKKNLRENAFESSIKWFDLFLSPQNPEITTKDELQFNSFQYASRKLTAWGGTPPYSWRLTAGDLPGGLDLTANGYVNGTPVETGTYPVVIKVSDSGTPSLFDEKDFNVVVVDPYGPVEITTDPIPPVTAGESYSEQMEAEGGLAPYFWSVMEGWLPEGLVMNNQGLISGETYVEPGAYDVTVKVTDSKPTPQEDTKEYNFEVKPGAMEIFSEYVPEGRVFEDYWGYVSVRMGMPPYEWTFDGEWPEGVSMSYGDASKSTINLSGDASQDGTFVINITIKDSGSPQQVLHHTITIIINPDK